MTDKIDMSLDDIIKADGVSTAPRKRSSLQTRSRPQFRRFGGRIGRSNNLRQKNVNKIQSTLISGRLLVSNLAYGVSDRDLNELFTSFGPLKKACVHYDQFGYSLGTAEVIFESKNDAMSALNKYNGVPLDGRAMRIQLVGGFSQNVNNNNQQYNGGVTRARGLRGARRGGNRGTFGGSGYRNRNQNQLTAEDLDKDLDSYKMEVE